MFREGYDLRAVTLAAFDRAGVTPHLVSQGGEMDGVLALVAAGLGAAVVPAIALPADRSLNAIGFTQPSLVRTVALAQRNDRTLARPARALADQLTARHGAGRAVGAAYDPASGAGV
jgi:DNA-binding transcriptional LysR family regulator